MKNKRRGVKVFFRRGKTTIYIKWRLNLQDH